MQHAARSKDPHAVLKRMHFLVSRDAYLAAAAGGQEQAAAQHLAHLRRTAAHEHTAEARRQDLLRQARALVTEIPTIPVPTIPGPTIAAHSSPSQLHAPIGAPATPGDRRSGVMLHVGAPRRPSAMQQGLVNPKLLAVVPGDGSSPGSGRAKAAQHPLQADGITTAGQHGHHRQQQPRHYNLWRADAHNSWNSDSSSGSSAGGAGVGLTAAATHISPTRSVPTAANFTSPAAHQQQPLPSTSAAMAAAAPAVEYSGHLHPSSTHTTPARAAVPLPSPPGWQGLQLPDGRIAWVQSPIPNLQPPAAAHSPADMQGTQPPATLTPDPHTEAQEVDQCPAHALSHNFPPMQHAVGQPPPHPAAAGATLTSASRTLPAASNGDPMDGGGENLAPVLSWATSTAGAGMAVVAVKPLQLLENPLYDLSSAASTAVNTPTAQQAAAGDAAVATAAAFSTAAMAATASATSFTQHQALEALNEVDEAEGEIAGDEEGSEDAAVAAEPSLQQLPHAADGQVVNEAAPQEEEEEEVTSSFAGSNGTARDADRIAGGVGADLTNITAHPVGGAPVSNEVPQAAALQQCNLSASTSFTSAPHTPAAAQAQTPHGVSTTSLPPQHQSHLLAHQDEDDTISIGSTILSACVCVCVCMGQCTAGDGAVTCVECTAACSHSATKLHCYGLDAKRSTKQSTYTVGLKHCAC